MRIAMLLLSVVAACTPLPNEATLQSPKDTGPVHTAPAVCHFYDLGGSFRLEAEFTDGGAHRHLTIDIPSAYRPHKRG